MRIKPFLAALAVAFCLLTYTPAAAPAPQKGPAPDPACVDYCVAELYECIAAGGTERKCGSAYRKCLAHCQNGPPAAAATRPKPDRR